MLIKIKRMISENNGYKRNIKFDEIYINANSIVSINDYDGVKEFLLEEGEAYKNHQFSLIKLKAPGGVENIIALGSARSIYETTKTSHRQILHD